MADPNERVSCNSPGCTNTMLPLTAEKTGGLCMPCVQAAASKKNQDYTKANRGVVNEFEGMTDRVAIIKLIHTQQNRDPLIIRTPYSMPLEQVYRELSTDEAERLERHTLSVIESDDDDYGEELLSGLAAYTDANLDDCLRAYIAHKRKYPFSPDFIFKKAPADIRDELIRLVDQDNPSEHLNHALCALAWIGDEVVVDLFKKWKETPPGWSNKLYIPPEDYAKQAGWELWDGKRRELCFPTCTRLNHGPSESIEQFQAAAPRPDHCPWCSTPLINLFEIDPSAFGLETRSLHKIAVPVCQICLLFSNIYGELDGDAKMIWSPQNIPPQRLPSDLSKYKRLPNNSFTPGGKRKFICSSWARFDHHSYSQIGGYPAWVDDAQYPKCTDCRKTMMFLGQLSDIGLMYAFICQDCETTATTYQQS